MMAGYQLESRFRGPRHDLRQPTRRRTFRPGLRFVRRAAALPVFLALSLAASAPATLSGQEAGPVPPAAPPGLSVAPASSEVPSFADVAGHDFGERITLHHQMVRYLEELARTSPRVALEEQGTSWEGRQLPVAIVTAPENHARLDEIRETAARLADPRRTDAAEAERLIRNQPAVVWMGGSIHGNELSGAEGLLKAVERLSTAEDEETRAILRDVVFLVDPILNPDGRDAFAHWNRRAAGPEPNPRRDDWGNDGTSWEGIGYRTGHYYFDTNRDWFAHTQRESRARLRTLHAWRPQVLVDAHEMSSDVEFFFDPPTDPVPPTFPPFAREWFPRFGEAYAAAFDSAGFTYMTRERYNYFYPGYTTAYGSYQGAVGMLYEQGSSRGLAIHRPDESVRTLADALEQQYLAAWTALRTAAEGREALLGDYVEAHRSDVEEGRRGVRRYLLPPDAGDPGLVAELADLLRRNGVEVERLTEPARISGLRGRTGEEAGSREFPAGTYVVDLAQPRGRLARTLLTPEVPVPETFLEEARARVERDENPRFYDITAWSLPLLFDLEAFGTTAGGALPLAPVERELRYEPGVATLELLGASTPRAAPRYAYLVDGRRAHALSVLHGLLERGYRASVLLRSTSVEGRHVPGGTVVVRTGDNPAGVHSDLTELARRYGVDVRGVDTGHGDSGHLSLGSDHVRPVRLPSVGLLADGPVHGYSFGWAWYTLAEQHGIPVTVLRSGSLARRPLDRIDVLVIPHLFSDDQLASTLGEAGQSRLADWVREGGTLVAVGSAVEFARTLELLDLRSWYETEEGEDAYAFDVPGAVFRAELDTLSWLSAGTPRSDLPVLVNSSRLYLVPDGPPEQRRRPVARYAEEAPARLSGHAWPETAERLPGTVFLYEQRVGQGRVVAFTEDPNFRAYWRGANRLFLNAVLLGPSAP